MFGPCYHISNRLWLVFSLGSIIVTEVSVLCNVGCVGHHVSFKKTLFLCLNKDRPKKTLRSGGVTFSSKSIKMLFYEMS